MRAAFPRVTSHLQLDDAQQVPLGGLQDGAALAEVDGVGVPPAVRVVEHLGGRVLHQHALLQAGLQRHGERVTHEGGRMRAAEGGSHSLKGLGSYFGSEGTGRSLVYGDPCSLTSHVEVVTCDFRQKRREGES